MARIAFGYAAESSNKPLGFFKFERRDPRDNDVRIDVLFCGVCHSDIHTAQGDWDEVVYPDGTVFPCVPGHEVIGRVAEVGSDVTRFKVGEVVGVGCMVDSCLQCESCIDGLEQHCANIPTWTYNSPDRITAANTYGGYSTSIVVRQEFVLSIRHAEKDLASVAPLLCAGITTWSPLRHWRVGKGTRVGIVGIGGLGHMGIKLAHAMEAKVVAFTTSPSKRDDALALGADEVVVSRDAEEMASQTGSLDFILNTLAVPHDLDAYTALLRRDGTMALVGIPAERHPTPSVASLVAMRRSIAGSLIGGIRETQEMLDFCAEKGVVASVEMIGMSDVNVAYQRMLKSDVKYRFVVDMASLTREASLEAAAAAT